jgi:hypothetical protein
MAGTFTKPMPIGDGKFIQPTGKKFSIIIPGTKKSRDPEKSAGLRYKH